MTAAPTGELSAHARGVLLSAVRRCVASNQDGEVVSRKAKLDIASK